MSWSVWFDLVVFYVPCPICPLSLSNLVALGKLRVVARSSLWRRGKGKKKKKKKKEKSRHPLALSLSFSSSSSLSSSCSRFFPFFFAISSIVSWVELLLSVPPLPVVHPSFPPSLFSPALRLSLSLSRFASISRSLFFFSPSSLPGHLVVSLRSFRVSISSANPQTCALSKKQKKKKKRKAKGPVTRAPDFSSYLSSIRSIHRSCFLLIVDPVALECFPSAVRRLWLLRRACAFCQVCWNPPILDFLSNETCPVEFPFST